MTSTAVLHRQPPLSPPLFLHPPSFSLTNFCSSMKPSSELLSEDISPSPIGKLPDASLLLSSPLSSQQIGSDHSSRVAAAMAENASRKREANGSSSSNVRGKIPRGNLPHKKDIPDTSSGLLMPPQLRGSSQPLIPLFKGEIYHLWSLKMKTMFKSFLAQAEPDPVKGYGKIGREMQRLCSLSNRYWMMKFSHEFLLRQHRNKTGRLSSKSILVI
ncbi:uncharacterized protein [Spinacia oleracea]|uniref:Uncharacterized protein isoform X2 n=1 Tax=Spinacia oleracea TaxID=3562 RepID=A0ABM3QHL2_SPIOL|nr:uncharacterized protein LOC110799037 isoform X2 [Spinacia oleracea]